MKKIILSALLFTLALGTTTAQDYQTGIGLRGGFYNGVTVKHFISDLSAVEGILTTRWRGFLVTGLYERHSGVGSTDLIWYYGFGGHVGIWGGNDSPFFENDGGTVIGADGIIGIEYTFSGVPFNLSLDWKPTFNIIGSTGFRADGIALSIRYVF